MAVEKALLELGSCQTPTAETPRPEGTQRRRQEIVPSREAVGFSHHLMTPHHSIPSDASLAGVGQEEIVYLTAHLGKGELSDLSSLVVFTFAASEGADP
jgi:hypothetical protein